MKPPLDLSMVDEELTVAQLIDRMRTGSRFTIDEILQQLSRKDDLGEGFMLHMAGVTYWVRHDSIKQYFQSNPKPRRSLNKEEENALLKSQLKEMEAELLKLKGSQIKPPKAQADTFPVQVDEEENPLEPEPLPLDVPEISQLRKDLASDLKGKKPISMDRMKKSVG